MDYLKIQEIGWQTVNAQSLKKIFRNGLIVVGNAWGENFLPLRFLPMGKNRYHLFDRSWKYVKSSLKKYPDWRPLYRSGNLANVAVNGWRATASKEDTSKVVVPRPHATSLKVAAEVVKVNKNELKQLLDLFSKTTLNDISTKNKTETITNE